MSNSLTVSKMKATIQAQAKDLGIVINLDKKPELRKGLYRKGEMLKEGQLKALIGKNVPVWADFTDHDHHDCSGVFVVASANDSESVMLEDGSCFALDFQFTGKDEEPCYDEGYDGDPMAIFEAVRKKRQ